MTHLKEITHASYSNGSSGAGFMWMNQECILNKVYLNRITYKTCFCADENLMSRGPQELNLKEVPLFSAQKFMFGATL